MNRGPIILIGGGGHCASCIDVIELSGRFEIVGIVDRPELVGNKLLGYPYIGSDQDLPDLISRYKNAFVTLGQIKSVAIRMKLVHKVLERGGNLPTIISPRAYVSRHVNLGMGNIVMHDVLINSSAKIGDHNIFNTKCLIEHDCIVGDFCHVATGATLNGGVKVGSRSFIGSGANVIQMIQIGDDVVIGANSTVKKNVESGSTLK